MKKIQKKYLFFCLFILLFGWSCSHQTFDLVIHDGMIIDGTGAEGYVADVVVFDPETIADRATFEDPHQYSEGILHVLIGGVSVIKNGEFIGILNGSPLVHNQSDKW